jgi:F5/8 type C domain
LPSATLTPEVRSAAPAAVLAAVTRRWTVTAGAAGGLLVLGAGVRALRFGGRFATPWHWDETSFAVQAVHLLDGLFPVNFLGVEYMGGTPAYVLAVWFAIAGRLPLALDLFAYAVGLAVFGTGYLVARRLLAPPAALVTLAVLAVPPLLLARRSLDGSLSYQFLLVLGHLFLLGTHTLFFRSGARAPALVGLGLLAGLGLWTNPLMVVYIAPFGVLALRTGLAWRRSCWLFVAAAVLGSLPAWLYDLTHYPSARLMVHEAGGQSVHSGLERLRIFGTQLLPVFLGLRLDDMGRGPLGVAGLALLLLGGVAVARAVVRDRGDLAWGLRARRPSSGGASLLLWAVFRANLGLVLLTSRGTVGDRYLLPLYSVVPCWIGELLAWLWGQQRAVGAAALAGFLGFHLSVNWVDTLGGVPPAQRRWALLDARIEPLVRWLDGHQIGRVYLADAPPWLASYELTYLTGMRIVAADLWREPVVRHANLVDAAAAPPVILWRRAGDPEHVEESLRRSLHAVGMETRETEVGGFLVVQPEPRFTNGFAPLPPDRWTITASHNAEEAVNLLDRDVTTRWSTGTPQAPGQWVALDLGAEEAVTRVDLLAVDWQEVPAGFRVEASPDGRGWQPVVEVPRYWGPLFFSEQHAFLKVRRGRVQTIFPPIRTRWLRVVRTGDLPFHDWSARELFVYAPAAPRPPAPPADPVAATLRERLDFVYTDHWLAAQIEMASRGAVGTPPSNLYTNSSGRALPDPGTPAAMRLAPGRAVLAGVDADGAGIRAMLAGRGGGVAERELGPYRLFTLTGPPAPPRPIAKDGWAATASDNGAEAWRAIDGDPRTAWTSASPLAPGTRLLFDFRRPRPVGRLRLVPGSAAGGPTSLAIEGSLDGVGWQALGPLRWTGALYWTGAEILRHGAGAWDLAFPPARVRYLAVTANGPPRGVWTVAEIECFE